MLSEKLLQYIWRYRYYRPVDLSTLAGEALQIIHPGVLNTNSGPDFLEAKIKIGHTIWAGNIEIHIRSSDWYRHHHQQDERYHNIILHVVFENDLPVDDELLQQIPCVELKDHIAKILLQKYQALMEQMQAIPCSAQLNIVPDITWAHWKNRLLIERWEQKTILLAEWLQQNNDHWEEAFYWLLARNFGMKVNATAFEMLAKITPLKLLVKYKSQPLQLEALLFGQAGLLSAEFKDKYPQQLKKEYQYLQRKHHLENMPASQWKWLRLRPVNFPAVRIAQLAALIHRSSHLFSRILETQTIEEIYALFEVRVNEYWNTHYRFDVEADDKPKHAGRQFIGHLIINVICPVICWYGRLRDNISLQEKALTWMQQLAPENNAVIREWEQLNIPVTNAADTQALLQLYQQYCVEKRCLECAIGNKILHPGHE